MWKYFVFLLNLTSHTCVTLPWCYVEIFFFFPFKSTIVYVRHSPLMWQAMYDNPVHMIFLVSDPQSIMLTTWLFQTYACQWNSSQKSDFFFFQLCNNYFFIQPDKMLNMQNMTMQLIRLLLYILVWLPTTFLERLDKLIVITLYWYACSRVWIIAKLCCASSGQCQQYSHIPVIISMGQCKKDVTPVC